MVEEVLEPPSPKDPVLSGGRIPGLEVEGPREQQQPVLEHARAPADHGNDRARRRPRTGHLQRHIREPVRRGDCTALTLQDANATRAPISRSVAVLEFDGRGTVVTFSFGGNVGKAPAELQGALEVRAFAQELGRLLLG